MLIGRTKEQALLKRAYESDESQFVAIYGRRRVGKTFLVREVFAGRFAFELTGLANTKTRGQLRNFQLSLRNAGMAHVPRPADWLEAFDLLSHFLDACSAKKKVVFIDELPWMDAPRSGFLAAFEHFWNAWASSRNDVLLIVCGSATSWIISNIVNNHGGLHNRVTAEIALRPFSLGECRDYARAMRLEMTDHQLLECYMIMGGVPYYWSKLRRESSLAQNVDWLFFAHDGLLRGEYHALYASLFRHPDHYMKVIEALSAKRSGMTRNELVDAAKLKNNGLLTRVLADLEYCGFIRRYSHYALARNGTIYQLIDNFTLFYYQFMAPNTRNDEHFWSNSIDSPRHRVWTGLAFERVCLQHVRQIKRALGVEGVVSVECAWQYRGQAGTPGTQIDLLIDRNDGIINLCEMKFAQDEVELDLDTHRNLMYKKTRFIQATGTRSAVHLTLVTVNGVKRNQYSDDIQVILKASDLFA